jgi:DNA-binding CsgD family transcriptional regulator
VSESITGLLDPARLLFDLQRANEIALGFAGCLEPEVIACRTTDGLIARFNCAFARIWLTEPDDSSLRLVASSGLYTRVDGSFARVPMGAYKVGKIAQNRVSFLSNNLAEEKWVKDREWAIANQIRGFAGFPLTVGDRVIGVLATFSHDALAPEFLEVLQVLCTTVAVALETALRYQQEKKAQPRSFHLSLGQLSLSDQLASVLGSARLTLIGTEQALTFPSAYIFLQAAEILNRMGCSYCRLIYDAEFVALEAIATSPNLTSEEQRHWVRSQFGMLFSLVNCLGGGLQSQTGMNPQMVQVLLKLPYPSLTLGSRLRIQCHLPVLQVAFTQLAHIANLQVCDVTQTDVPLLTDNLNQIQPGQLVIWLQQSSQPIPKGVRGVVDLTITAKQLREAVAAIERGETWHVPQTINDPPLISEREREILKLLAEGLRDRDIANRLVISESTVKFHINNVLAKLKARTRFQALYQVITKGWL